LTYLAIARKYRPSTFAEMVGQQHVTRTLTNAINTGRVHHAYLFCGARGVGKTTAARALSRGLNCEKGPTPEPCGTCTSCTEIVEGRSPDLIEIDGASNNSVDDVRELRESVRYAPTQGRSKIYLIDEVHMLSKGAFNALLKTLEEPPPGVVFIFATTEPQKIPDTILSRVQRFDFKRIHVDAVAERLEEIAKKEGVTVDKDALKLIARCGEGSMRDSQSLLDQVIASTSDAITVTSVVDAAGLVDRSILYQMLGGLLNNDPAAALSSINAAYGYGYELSQFTADMLELLRNATFARLSDASREFLDVPEDEIAKLDEITRDATPALLNRIFSAMLEVHDTVSHAARPRIVLDMAVARLTSMTPEIPLPELIERMERMERGVRHQPTQSTAHRAQHQQPPQPQRTTSTRQNTPRQDRRAPTPAPSQPKTATAPTDKKDEPRPAPPKSEPPKDSTPKEDPQISGFRERLSQGGERTKHLREGNIFLVGSQLKVFVKSTRHLQQARKIVRSPIVIDALQASFGDNVSIVLALTQQSTASSNPRFDEVMRDPDAQRIIQALDATLSDISSDSENS
jgi:DNA polymerase-3 subunit gamma/tau